jgi:hypothetical protein
MPLANVDTVPLSTESSILSNAQWEDYQEANLFDDFISAGYRNWQHYWRPSISDLHKICKFVT